MSEGSSNLKWFLIGFHGHLEASKRRNSWELIVSFTPGDECVWCVIGDFNKIVSQDEKQEGR